MRIKEITAYFKNHFGYARLKDLTANGFHTRDIANLLESNVIKKVKSGLYRLSDNDYSSLHDYVELCLVMPKSVICLHSALAYYDLTTFVPSKIMIAVPKGYHASKIEYPPFRTFFFSEGAYKTGIETIQSKSGIFRIYSQEKSICDAFRFRNRLGFDIAKEALSEYMKKRDKNIETLVKFSKTCRMYNIMKPYIDAFLT